MSTTVRARKMMNLACEIARRELFVEEQERELRTMRERFSKMIEHVPQVELVEARLERRPVLDRPRLHVPMKSQVLALFIDGAEHPAGEVVAAFPNCRTEVVHTTLSKLAAEKALVRVAWGVYRRA